MEYLQSILLGVVQGIAEFLPISSSGHLVLGEVILGRFSDESALALGAADSNLTLNIALHLGTLGSIVVIYWRQLWEALWQPQLVAAIVVATIPAGLAGVLLKDQLEKIFGSPLAVGCALCFTALLLWTSRRFDRGEATLPEVSLKQAIAIGMFQAVALIPGVSRSGSTIVCGQWVGLQREAAATFSFLMAVPVIAGAAVLMAAKLLQQGTTTASQWKAYGVGAGVAFVVGVIALKWLLTIISRRKLHHIAWYCLMVGLLTIGLSLLSGLRMSAQ
jgi:undecaprenyl-diphosphatase